MSPVRHQVSGPALQFSLADEISIVKQELGDTTTRSARTLVKDGPLRVTLVAVKPGGELKPHRADGPITLQVLEGEITFQAEGQSWTMRAESLFVLDAGITHSVRSTQGGVFLLTVVALRDGKGNRDQGPGARDQGTPKA